MAPCARTISLESAAINICSDAQALIYIARHILTIYSAAEWGLLDNCSSWFTDIVDDYLEASTH